MLSYSDYCSLRRTCKYIYRCSPTSKDITTINKNSRIRSVIYNYDPPKYYLPITTETFYIDNPICMYNVILNENLKNIIINGKIKDLDMLKYIDKYCKNLRYLKCNINIDLSLYEFKKTLICLKAPIVSSNHYENIKYIKCEKMKYSYVPIEKLKCIYFKEIMEVKELTIYSDL